MNKSWVRAETIKPHSGWWDSYISQKNSKWMADNIDEMDRSVKQMLKLIEGDGDSFAKKADMYYQKRPELISLVEDFYRMYRSLAERYDHLTGELRKNIPSEMQLQSSGVSDAEQISPIPTHDRRRPIRRRSSIRRAAGFDFFLGSAGIKDGKHSSSPSSDSDMDSDASSINNYSVPPLNGNAGEGLNQRVIELEIELRDVTERLREAEDGNRDGGNSKIIDFNNRSYEKLLLGKIAGYDQQLRITKEKLKLAEEEIIVSMKLDHNSQAQLELAQKDIQVVETENKTGEGRSFDLQEQISRLKTSVSDLDSGSLIEILKISNTRRFGDKRSDMSEELKEELGEVIILESSQNSSGEEGLQGEISNLTEREGGDGVVEALNKEDLEALKLKYDMVVVERDGLKAKVEERVMTEEELGGKVRELKEEVERQRMAIYNGAEEKREAIRQLCFSLEHYRNRYQQLRKAFYWPTPQKLLPLSHGF